MASHQVCAKGKPSRRGAHCVMKQKEHGEREDGSACGKLFEESKQTKWRDWTAHVGGRDENSHERTLLRTSDEEKSTVKGSSDHLVGGKVEIQTGVNTVGRIGTTPLTATLKGS